MPGLGMKQGSASVGKGITSIVKHSPAQVIAVAAAMGIFTISAAIATGTFLVKCSQRPAPQQASLHSAENQTELWV